MNKLFPAIALLALTATAATAHADESAYARAELRQNLATFWGVAEDKVRSEVATSAVHSREPVTTVTPAERAVILNERYSTHPRGQIVMHQGTVYQPPPQKTVQMHQQTHHSKDDKQFGLTIFGGLKLFQFSWGGESSSETDGLTGSL